MTSPSKGTAYLLDPTEHTYLSPYLAYIHLQCITHDKTMASFLPPLSQDKVLGWWKARFAETREGQRMIVVLVDESEPGTKLKGPEVMGVVTLWMPESETGPYRGYIEKLFIMAKFRGRSGARTLMDKMEEEAVKKGKTLLMLDTETGAPSEAIYKRLGYIEVGKIPDFGFKPDGAPGEKRSETFFYKHL